VILTNRSESFDRSVLFVFIKINLTLKKAPTILVRAFSILRMPFLEGKFWMWEADASKIISTSKCLPYPDTGYSRK